MMLDRFWDCRSSFRRALAALASLFLIVVIVKNFPSQEDSDLSLGTIHDPKSRALLRAVYLRQHGLRNARHHHERSSSEAAKRQWSHEQKIARKVRIETNR